jgi:tRNA(Ile)-lysidine synthetase, N-terminal domain/tRNA(Ile)-lysidine synthetase, C-terminal domain
MKSEVRKYIEKHKLLTIDKPVLVGLSGGADSIALLAVLCDLGYNCIGAHCNFHLRGDESDRDELFARTFAERRNVPFCKVDFQTKEYAAANQISIEMAARELRYQWFEQLRVELAAQAVAVAHHEQDNVETVLLNLIRGTGIRGLTGMSPRNGSVVRPLLTVKKSEILAWLKSAEIAYVVDSSNLSDEYARNFLRLKVIPLLEELNPSVSQAITRTAGNLTETEAVYTYAIHEIRDKVFADPYTILIKPLLDAPAPKTVLYELLKPFGFNRSVVNDIFFALEGESGKVFFSAEFQLLKNRDRLLIRPLSDRKAASHGRLLYREDTEIHNPIKLSLCVKNIKDVRISKEKNIATIDYDKLEFPLSLRRWAEGDWFIPFGMKGRKKISDYFTDRKLSLFAKENVWLLCSGENIVWIIGERLDNRFCMDENTKQVLVVHFFE